MMNDFVYARLAALLLSRGINARRLDERIK